MNIVAGCVILLLACIGNAEMWVILMNRRHSLKYRHDVLRRVRHVHDAGMTLFPLFLIACAGLSRNGLLRGGTFAEQVPVIQAIIGIACCGLVPFCVSVIRWQMNHRPERFTDSSAEIIDVLKQQNTDESRQLVLGETSGFLWKLPFNQIFQVEVNQRRLDVFGDVPWPNGTSHTTLRLAHFSDVHLIGCPGQGFHQFVADRLRSMQPDAFVFTGDLLDRLDLLPQAVDLFRQIAEVAPGYFILGNHDWDLGEEAIRAPLAETGWTDLGEKSLAVQMGGVEVVLAGTEAPWIGSNPKVPERANEAIRILLSHSPDQRDFALDNDFDLMLCGHNHGGQVRLPVIGPVYSPSKFGVLYSGGVYEKDHLLIHVSRGTGAMDAFRWNCRPEITLLELRIPVAED